MNVNSMGINELRLAVQELRRYPVALKEREAEVERLQDVAQDVICDPGSVHLDGVTKEKLQAVRGKAVGRFLSESEGLGLIGDLKAKEAEVERLTAEVQRLQKIRINEAARLAGLGADPFNL